MIAWSRHLRPSTRSWGDCPGGPGSSRFHSQAGPLASPLYLLSVILPSRCATESGGLHLKRIAWENSPIPRLLFPVTGNEEKVLWTKWKNPSLQFQALCPSISSDELCDLRWSEVKVHQLCLTLCHLMDYTVHGILQDRIVEWVAFPFSRGSSQPKDWTQVFCFAGRLFTNWNIREALAKNESIGFW